MGSLKVEDLSVYVNNKRVLSNIYFECKPGTLVGVMGPNGAGKSTLFKAILGLTKISSGKITFNDQPIDNFRSQIAYLPQKDQVDWSFPATVLDVVMMGRYAHKKTLQRMTKFDREIAMESMLQMDIEHLKSRQISNLSGGQQQRVFIARALCQEATYFFFDEPFVGVDTVTEGKTVEILQQLSEDKKTLLVVHHDLSTVATYFDQVMLLNQRLVAYGNVRDTFLPDKISATFGGQLSILQKAGLLQKK